MFPKSPNEHHPTLSVNFYRIYSGLTGSGWFGICQWCGTHTDVKPTREECCRHFNCVALDLYLTKPLPSIKMLQSLIPPKIEHLPKDLHQRNWFKSLKTKWYYFFCFYALYALTVLCRLSYNANLYLACKAQKVRDTIRTIRH